MSPAYLGPDIRPEAALELQSRILQKALWMDVGKVTVVILDSRGQIVSSNEFGADALVLAEGKAVSALEFDKDTIELRHAWEQSGVNSGEGEWIELRASLSESEIADARELEPRFTDLAGGALIKDHHGATVVGAIGVVTDQGEIIDHKLASFRPQDFAIAA